MKKINRISVLKSLEYFFCTASIFLITSSLWLPKNVLNVIYNFGYGKFGALIIGLFASVYFSIAIKEKEYLKNKFTVSHYSNTLLLAAFCMVLYIIGIF